MTRLVNQGEYNSGPFFAIGGWNVCSAASLRGHIVHAHLRPQALAHIGVPRFDIEVAKHRELDLDWVVIKALDKLASPNGSVSQTALTADALAYQCMLAKTLRLIHDEGLSDVPWNTADELFPGASTVNLDLGRDTTDISFFGYKAQLEAEV